MNRRLKYHLVFNVIATPVLGSIVLETLNAVNPDLFEFDKYDKQGKRKAVS